MDLFQGLPVRIRAMPEVDPLLWDQDGFVLRTQSDKVVVELTDGRDVACLPEQLEVRSTPDVPGRPR